MSASMALPVPDADASTEVLLTTDDRFLFEATRSVGPHATT